MLIGIQFKGALSDTGKKNQLAFFWLAMFCVRTASTMTFWSDGVLTLNVRVNEIKSSQAYNNELPPA